MLFFYIIIIVYNMRSFKKCFSKANIASIGVLICGIAASFGFLYYLRSEEYEKILVAIDSDGFELGRSFYRNSLLQTVDNPLPDFITSSPGCTFNLSSISENNGCYVTLENYVNFTSLYLTKLNSGRGSSTDISWHPIIKQSEREIFEEFTTQVYDKTIQITDRSPDDYFGEPYDDINGNDDLWPLLYQYPFDESALGFNIYSDDRYRKSLDYVVETNKGSVTSRIFSKVDGQPTLKFLHPVFKSTRDTSLVGVIGHTINLSEAFNKILANPTSNTGRFGPFLDVYPKSKIRIYLENDEFEEIVFDSSIEIDAESSIGFESSSDFIESSDENYVFQGFLDRGEGKTISYNIIFIASPHVPYDFAIGTLLFLLLFTIVVSLGVYKWRSLLSQRKNALDIAISQSESKSKFVSEISHEFRNPLNGIIGMLDILREETTTKTGASYMKIARSCSKVMLGLVNDILDFSKIESGGMEIVRCPFSVRDILEETMGVMFVSFRKENSVKLILEIDESVPDGLSDIDDVRVRQILTNLLSNALKFTNSGSVTLKARCSIDSNVVVPIVPADLRLHVQVIDTGIGMTSEGLSKLFQPFSQVHNARTTKAGGTGLGLVVCKNLCELMDGSIHVESKYRKGTTFSFDCTFGPPETCVPKGTFVKEWDLSKGISEEVSSFVDDDGFDKQPSKPVIDRVGSCFNDRCEESRRPSIIVADDMKVNRLIIERILAPLKCELHFAKDGGELLDMCNSRKYSMILTDVMMPVMSGTEVSRQLSTGHGPNRDTPKLAISGSPSDGGMMTDHVVKPVAKSVLYNKISNYITDSEVTWISRNWDPEN